MRLIEVVLFKGLLQARLLLVDQQLVLVDGVDQHDADNEHSAHTSQDGLVSLLCVWQHEEEGAAVEVGDQCTLRKTAAARAAACGTS